MKNTSSYAQALVQLKSAAGARELIHTLQAELDRAFPRSLTLVRQLEQGPPFDAPIEVRLFGPDIDVLRELGDEVRVVLGATPDVLHTRSELSEALPKISLVVDEQQARLVGLDHSRVAGQLNATLEGAIGDPVLEATEQLPVRVRVSNSRRSDLDEIASLELISSDQAATDAHPGIPLTVLADLELAPEIATIPRLNGQRMNEVKAYVTAGEPAAVREVVIRSTRHVVATSLTTIAGFTPLFLAGGGFWPPLAVAIAGGVGGATFLALFFIPSAYVLVMCRRCEATFDKTELAAAAPLAIGRRLQPSLASVGS